MLENRAKTKLATGDYAVGAMLTWVRNPALVRIIASAGYDFVFIDMEHSSFSIETVADMCEMARVLGVTPIVRPHQPDRGVGERLLDSGAMGLMHPNVTRREQVDQFLEWMQFPPIGTRGQAGGGSVVDYESVSMKTANEFVNKQTMLIVQIESREGIDHIDEILTGGGVDVVEIGRGDLCKALGVPGERQHPLVLDAVKEIAAGCHRHDVAIGAGPDSPDDADELIAVGVRFLLAHLTDLSALQRTYRSEHQMISAAIERRGGRRGSS
jgi:2-keto-3-deoxy-L-rhamnonate aldolase RhmA